ncbi:MAG: TRAP transporter substrate-binding protein DctP [Thermodesulfobacteriota bacterium]
MKRRWKAFSATLVLAWLSLAGPAFCQSQDVVVYWRFATLAPKGSGWSRLVDEMLLPVVKDASNGQVQIKTYYGGIMGDDEQVIEKLKAGVIEGAGLSAQGTTQACPEMSVVELPFLFRNYQEVDYIKGKMTREFGDLFLSRGFYLLAWIDQDFDQVYSTKYPLTTLAQFSEATFITWYGPMEEDLLKVLGAKMVHAEVPEAANLLRSGKADSGIAPGLWVVASQLQNYVKYINPMKIRYSPAVIVISRKAWDELPEKFKAKYLGLQEDLIHRYCLAIRTENEKSLTAMYQYGLTKVEASPEDLAAIQKTCRKVWEDCSGKLFPKELLDQIQGHLKGFRRQ